MRHLLQPRTLNRALLAAAVSTLACWPRLESWSPRALPLPFLLFTIFICSIVLWSFVFAWHVPYSGRPVFLARFEPRLWLGATLAGTVLALVCRRWLDPVLRAALPEDYPASGQDWVFSLPFVFAFGQLFLTFAPCDWLLRLCRNPRLTVVLVAAFGVGITAMKLQAHAGEISLPVFAVFLAGRFAGALLAAVFYLRGGMALAWWWALLFELRLLPELI